MWGRRIVIIGLLCLMQIAAVLGPISSFTANEARVGSAHRPRGVLEKAQEGAGLPLLGNNNGKDGTNLMAPIFKNHELMEDFVMTFDPVSVLFGSGTLIAVVILGFILSAQNARTAAAFNKLNKAMSEWMMIQIKDRRAQRVAEIRIENPLQWVTLQCGVSVTQQQRCVEQAKAVDLLSPDGVRVVVSTLDKDDLMKVIAPMSKGVGGQLVEPLLGRNPRKVEPIVRDLSHNEFFDYEAGQVAQMFGINWGQPARLYFYVVPLK